MTGVFTIETFIRKDTDIEPMKGRYAFMDTLNRLYDCIGKEIRWFEKHGYDDNIIIFDKYHEEMTTSLFESRNYYELSLVYEVYATMSRNARQLRWGYNHTINYITVMYGLMSTYAYYFSGNSQLVKLSSEINRCFLQKAIHCCTNWHEVLPYHIYEPMNFELMGDICVFLDDEIAGHYYQKALDGFAKVEAWEQQSESNEYYYMITKELERLIGSFIGETIRFSPLGYKRIAQKKAMMDKLLIFQ